MRNGSDKLGLAGSVPVTACISETHAAPLTSGRVSAVWLFGGCGAPAPCSSFAGYIQD